MAAGLLGGVILSFPFDPWSMSAAVLLMAPVGIAAASASTFRAIRVDPASTLREIRTHSQLRARLAPLLRLQVRYIDAKQ
jgi:hypothetical protein